MVRRLLPIGSYALYYGAYGETFLSRYDLVVTDSGRRGPEGLRRIKQSGTLALAYVSTLEVPRVKAAWPPSNALTVSGVPQVNEPFGNWILDPRLDQTRIRLLSLVEQAYTQGYDGVFMDCLGDVEDERFEALRGEILPAAAWLVAEVARRYPSCILVQNWGLHHLLPLTAEMLDGVCWEDFPYRQVAREPQRSGVRNLQKLQQSLGLRVLALNHGLGDEASYLEARDAADRCGFLWYGCRDYLHLPATSFADSLFER